MLLSEALSPFPLAMQPTTSRASLLHHQKKSRKKKKSAFNSQIVHYVLLHNAQQLKPLTTLGTTLGIVISYTTQDSFLIISQIVMIWSKQMRIDLKWRDLVKHFLIRLNLVKNFIIGLCINSTTGLFVAEPSAHFVLMKAVLNVWCPAAPTAPQPRAAL